MDSRNLIITSDCQCKIIEILVIPLHEVRMAIDCGKFHEGFSRGNQSESVIWQTRSYLDLSGKTIQGNNQLYRPGLFKAGLR